MLQLFRKRSRTGLDLIDLWTGGASGVVRYMAKMMSFGKESGSGKARLTGYMAGTMQNVPLHGHGLVEWRSAKRTCHNIS